MTDDEIVSRLSATPDQEPVSIYAPLVRNARGSHRTLLQLLVKEFGANAILADSRSLSAFSSKDPHQFSLEPSRAHDIDVLLGSFDSNLAAGAARGMVDMARALGAQTISIRGPTQIQTMSWTPACTNCGAWFSDLEPVHFHSRCPHCDGEGCPACHDTGLLPQAASVRWSGRRITELLSQSVLDVNKIFSTYDFPEAAARLRREITARLASLTAVGLGYLSLDRSSPTLSRGEAQRVRLAVILTSQLEDMLHVLDEPTIGQHPADISNLLEAMRSLKGPVVYVEHDRVAAAAADEVIDLGPGAGALGGRLVFQGPPSGLWQADTATGRYFSLRDRVPVPELRPSPEDSLLIRGANKHNLRAIDVNIPLGRLSVVSGVSGSGKSTLVEDVIAASLSADDPIGCRSIEGPPLQAVVVDQKPIGRNPRSSPATFTKLSDVIRDYFALISGLSPSHFSFNRKEGACPVCKGMGAVEVKMRYLPSTWIPCSACGGRRFSDEICTIVIPFGDRSFSIDQIYALSIAEVRELFESGDGLSTPVRSRAMRILTALGDLGLDYLPLGQASPTLSGGEAQRVKLAKYLGRSSLNRQFLILDEPTTGLHPQDISGLLIILDRLVRAGATQSGHHPGGRLGRRLGSGRRTGRGTAFIRRTGQRPHGD
jgi:excinuclease ABC subunit A